MKILVVEDDELSANGLTAILTQHNYVVEVAHDSSTAWDLIETYNYDLIILDVMLPKIDGISLCRQLRSSGRQMPILLLTGCHSTHDKAIGLDAGADDYVVKPFVREELVARVRALLRRGVITSQPILKWGNLKLDPSSCQVTYRGKLLSLTPKEYALLELFLRNHRRVFSCSMILEHLWSYQDTPGEEAVRTHIKGLRQKLKAVGAKSDLIETVYGIGYRLKELTAELEVTQSSLLPTKDKQVEQETLAAIAGIWQKCKPRVHEQVEIIQQAITMLDDKTKSKSHKNYQECLTLAKQQAHTLAGSLGTFGLGEASQVARNIECLLASPQFLASAEIAQLQTSVNLLREQIAAMGDSYDLGDESVKQPLTMTILDTFKILALDDDPHILILLENLLTPWGMEVMTISDPQDLWTSLDSIRPDILVLDVEMPHMNGIEICKLLRNDPHWSELPILFLTVHNDREIINQVFSAGADDFVSKPIVAPELLTRIINRLERVKLLRRVYEKGNESSSSTVAETESQLQLKVAERTAELVNLNTSLQSYLEERREIEEVLRISQARLARILDIADDAIISTDGNQIITLFNQGAEKMFGYSAHEVIGQKLDLLLPERFAQAHRQHVNEFGKSPSLSRRMGERKEIFARRQDGSEFPAEASISKFNLSNEYFYTVILRDITARKQIERMKDEFVSVVSHELRTPLTSIHGSLGMLASGLLKPDSEQAKRLLQIATESTERLVRLINDILDIERIESGKVKMARETCNLADLINSTVSMIESLADKAEVHLSVSSLSLELWADADRIVQTLTNLLSNAIKFSPKGSTVYLRTEKKGDTEVLLTVRDTGRGIPTDKLESIFERFQQVDSSDSRNHDGTGLGLAICRSIVQQHGGRIWVESVVGEGSTFYLLLPIHSSLPVSPLVLICDDDQAICLELQSLLENAGYRVLTVGTGEEALALAANQQPNVILLDLLMSGMNGWQTVALLKEQTNTKNIPIVMCSVYKPDSGNLSSDFADWMSKPAQEGYLLRSLQQVVATCSQRVKILIVEDDNDLAQLLVSLFQRHEIDTFLAKTGLEAIRLSQQVNPDLLILDLILPECDGFAVVDWLRQHNHLCRTPVVIYSAKDLDKSQHYRLKLGHTEFFTKGRVTIQEFEQRVLELLQRMTHQ